MKIHYSKNQKGLQRAIIQTKKSQQKPELQKQKKVKNHSKERLLRESRPHNGLWGSSLGKTPELLVDSPGQE